MRSRSLRSIAEAIGGRAVGDGGFRVRRPRHPAEVENCFDLALAMDPRLEEALLKSGARAAVLSEGADWRALGLDGAVMVGHARFAMAGVTEVFARAPEIAAGVHSTAVVHPTAALGASVAIGPFAEVGAGARIGDRSRVLGNATIAAEASVGVDCLVHPGVRVGDRVRIGDRAIIHPNACIGVDGFSFLPPNIDRVAEAKAGRPAPPSDGGGRVRRVHSLGSVRIGNDVEIGANCAIDRGTVADTVIGSGTKLDNLVHIAHNVRVGEHCLICGQVGVAGSAEIGDRCILGGQVGVGDHVVIGADCVIGGKAMVGRRVRAGRMLVGWASLERDEFHAVFRAIRRLARRRGSGPEVSLSARAGNG